MKMIRKITLTAILVVIAVSVQAVRAPEEHGADSVPAIDRRAAGVNSEPDGFRARIEDCGLTVQFTYTGEAFHSFNLIPGDVNRYRGLVELRFTLDTGKIGLWPEGEFFIYGQNGHGKGLVVNPAGEELPISDIDARNFNQISQFGLQQGFLDDKAKIRLGKQDVNEIFDVNQYGGNFIFPAYTLTPTVPMPTFPAPSLGATLLIEPAGWLSLGTGIYDGAPKAESLGFDTTFDGKGGYFSILETAWKPDFGAKNQYAGNYRLGLWYHSGDFAATGSDSNSRMFSGNFGIYLMFDQLIFKEQHTADDDDQGLGVFFQFGWAPSDRNPVWQYTGAGLSYKGLFRNREQDSLNIGLNYSWLASSGSAGDSKSHLANIEVFYICQLTSRLRLQPDIQYYDNPLGDGRPGFAGGLRWMLRF